MKRDFIKGTLILTVGTFIARIIGIFFKIPLTFFLGTEGLAYYTLAYTYFGVISSLFVGIPNGVSIIVSNDYSKGRYNNIASFMKSCFIFVAILSTIVSLLSIAISPLIIRNLKWSENVSYSIYALIGGMVAVSSVAVFKGYFIAINKSKINALSLIIEASSRLIIGLGLMFFLLKYGLSYSAAGAAFGTIIGAVMSSFYFYIKYKKSSSNHLKKMSDAIKIDSNKAHLKRLIIICIPITLSSFISALMPAIDAILTNLRLYSAGFSLDVATQLYGKLASVTTLLNLPMALLYPIAISIIPEITKYNSKDDKDGLSLLTEKIFMVNFVIALPSVIGLGILAEPIMKIIFPTVADSGSLLKLGCLYLYLILINQIYVSIMQGLKLAKLNLFNLIIGIFIKVITSYILIGIPSINIYGAMIGTICAYFYIATANYYCIRSRIKNISNDIKLSFKIIISSILMGMFAYVTEFIVFKSQNFTSLVTTIIASTFVYVLLLFMLNQKYVSENFNIASFKWRKNERLNSLLKNFAKKK